MANIEITQEDDDDEEGKSSKKKKKKKNKSKKEEQDEEEKEEEFTEEEKKLYKIYKRAFHLLRKAIRSYNRRNKIEPEKDLENRFNKWKNENAPIESVKKNLIGEYIKDEEIKETNDTNLNKEKEEEIKQLSHNRKDNKIEDKKEDTKKEKEEKEYEKVGNEEEEEEEKNEKLDKKEEDNKKEEEVGENKEIKEGETKRGEKEEVTKGGEKEEVTKGGEKEEVTKGGEKKEELKKDNEEEEEEEKEEEEDKNKEDDGDKKEKKKEESHDNNILISIDELIKSNNKIQNSAFNIIKRSGEKIYDKLDPQNFIKILELNNKRISAYQIFCLYTNYNENPPLCIKTIFPKKFYFNYWYKTLINKADK